MESGKKPIFPRVFSRPHVEVGVPHPGAALCWFRLEDRWDCMSSGKALSAGRESCLQTLKYSCKNLVSRVVTTRAFHTAWPGLDCFPATGDTITERILQLPVCWVGAAIGPSGGNTQRVHQHPSPSWPLTYSRIQRRPQPMTWLLCPCHACSWGPSKQPPVLAFPPAAPA